MHKLLLLFLLGSMSIAVIVGLVINPPKGLVKGVNTQIIPTKNLIQKIQPTPIVSPTPQPTATFTPSRYDNSNISNQYSNGSSYIPPFSTATPIPQQDNTIQIQQMTDIFKRIAQLNVQISTYQAIGNESAKGYTCDRNKYSSEYLPDGSDNPDYIFNPFDREKLYQQCLQNQGSTANMYGSSIEGLKSQIRDLNNQLLGIVTTCGGTQCNTLYQQMVVTFEEKGFYIH